MNDYITPDGRTFWHLASIPHECKDGRQIELAVWHSECVDCGASFTVSTPLNYATSNAFTRSKCDTHKMSKQEAADAWGLKVRAAKARGKA